MRRYDAIVVGAGPAGSSCAWRLREAGLDVAVLERADFPRTKLCAGWITPQVVEDLRLDVGRYPHRFMTFDALCIHWGRRSYTYASRQHSIRRLEFDDYLLRRSGADVHTHTVKRIDRVDGDYVVDGRFQSRFLIGAAGTACPVYRGLFRAANPRARRLQTATLECEFAYEWKDPACHLWFFGHGLPGYAWYVPKQDGYINIGLGGMAGSVKAGGKDLRDYWRRFIDDLNAAGLVRGRVPKPGGYSYYLRGNVDSVRIDNAFIVGDAVGLATVDLCEGIGPAVQSALLAADAITGEREYSLRGIARRSGRGLFSRYLAARFSGTFG
jgi:flavin-dependent dehydrogenase